MTARIDRYRRLPTMAIFGACLALAGCASSPSSGDTTAAERRVGEPSDCLFNRGVRDFTALDNRNLILYGPGNRAYHVVLTSPSFDLEREYEIGIYDRDGRICPFGGDAVIVRGTFTERIPIRSIEAISDEDADALKVRFGKEGAAPEDLVTVTDIDPDDE
jgi:Family of unknown function (DUF6491)